MRGGGHRKRLHTDLGQSLTGDDVGVGRKMLNAIQRGDKSRLYIIDHPRRVPGEAGYCWE